MSFRLFERFGVELEYMLVERTALDVLPVSDRVLAAVAGQIASEVEVGELSWSNELVLHVIELKTGAPASDLDGLAPLFQRDVRRIHELLDPLGGRLMPGGMHPWMDPATQTQLWPHESSPIYAAFDRIFNCRGHGWSNLQAIHLNLPFADDDEFGRLHAAIRLILPILPALAASSPIVDGQPTGVADTRLEVYRSNARKIPEVTGQVIPEPVFTRADYEEQILQPIYDALAPFDPEGTLHDEWANARGAIARFSRNTIEIRVLDMQECPAADLAVLTLIVAALRALVEQRWCKLRQQQGWAVAPLSQIFLSCIREGDQAVIRDSAYLRVFGIEQQRCTARMLWKHLFRELFTPRQRKHDPGLAPLHVILRSGCLARRILAAAGENPNHERLESVYRMLCDCLAEGRALVPQPLSAALDPPRS